MYTFVIWIYDIDYIDERIPRWILFTQRSLIIGANYALFIAYYRVNE